MSITEITKRDILDALNLSGIAWNGRLDEVDFLSRLYNLEELPSYDPRHTNMSEDIFRHRILNEDWEDGWVFQDSRLNLLSGSDEQLLKFFCEMLHPVVRSNKDEIEQILTILNTNLQHDGYKIVVEKHISGRPVYGFSKEGAPIVSIENKKRIGRRFILEQLEKCDKKIAEGDYDGAITNARSLVEDVIARDIYKQATGKELKTKGDLVDDYNKLKKILNLAPQNVDGSFKTVATGMTSIINGLASIRNKMGDGHSREIKPLKHHAKFVVNSAKVFVEFLYDVLEYQKQRKGKLYSDLIELPHIRYGEGTYYNGRRYNLSDRKALMSRQEIKSYYEKCDPYLQYLLKEELIKSFDVESFENSDRFLISLTVFFDVLSEEDLLQIYEKHKDNNQLALKAFLKDVFILKPGLITNKALLGYIGEV